MKKYSVFGLGNAIVDMEIKVGEEFLQRMGLRKGMMELIDGQRQRQLEELVGEIPSQRSCGGSAGNSIMAMSQLGAKAFFCGKVASDERGDFFLDDLKRQGVDSSCHKRGDGDSGVCMVFITPDADRTMNTYLGVNEGLAPEDIAWEALEESEYLYIEGYMVSCVGSHKAALESIKFARKSGIKVALTFSDLAMVKFFYDGLSELLDEGVDLLFCNGDEALEFTGSNSVEEAVSALSSKVSMMAVTLGEKGAAIWDGSELNYVDTKKVVPVDSNGAGDMFAGCFLYGLYRGWDCARAGDLACSAATTLVTSYGARMKTEQIQEILGQV